MRFVSLFRAPRYADAVRSANSGESFKVIRRLALETGDVGASDAGNPPEYPEVLLVSARIFVDADAYFREPLPHGNFRRLLGDAVGYPKLILGTLAARGLLPFGGCSSRG